MTITEVVTTSNDDRNWIEFVADESIVGELVTDEETPEGHVAVIVYVPISDVIGGTV